MWHKKETLPKSDSWILAEINDNTQKYKVFRFVAPDWIVAGNYQNKIYTIQNYSTIPIIRWIYINDIIKLK